MSRIIVVGSLNIDIVTRVKRFPLPGETLSACDTQFIPGGKGANQAVAAARCGASVAMVGAVGEDAFGRAIQTALTHEQIDTTALVVKPSNTTGCAIITVDKDAHNTILVSSGANAHLLYEEVASAIWRDCAAVLLQNEISLAVTRNTVRDAKAHGVPVYYNPSPVLSSPDVVEIVAQTDYLFVNEHEARALTDVIVDSPASAFHAASVLCQMGARTVVVTLGDQGAVMITDEGTSLHMPAYSVAALDSTGAGDTLVGAFAAAILTAHSASEALRRACAAAALCVTRLGAQAAMPTKAQIDGYLALPRHRRWEE